MAEAQSVVLVPLLAEGELIGLLGAADKPGGFTDGDVQILSTFAGPVATFLRSRQSFDRQRRQAARFERLAALVGDMAAVSGRAKLLELTVRRVQRDLGYERVAFHAPGADGTLAAESEAGSAQAPPDPEALRWALRLASPLEASRSETSTELAVPVRAGEHALGVLTDLEGPPRGLRRGGDEPPLDAGRPARPRAAPRRERGGDRAHRPPDGDAVRPGAGDRGPAGPAGALRPRHRGGGPPDQGRPQLGVPLRRSRGGAAPLRGLGARAGRVPRAGAHVPPGRGHRRPRGPRPAAGARERGGAARGLRAARQPGGEDPVRAPHPLRSGAGRHRALRRPQRHAPSRVPPLHQRRPRVPDALRRPALDRGRELGGLRRGARAPRAARARQRRAARVGGDAVPGSHPRRRGAEDPGGVPPLPGRDAGARGGLLPRGRRGGPGPARRGLGRRRHAGGAGGARAARAPDGRRRARARRASPRRRRGRAAPSRCRSSPGRRSRRCSTSRATGRGPSTAAR